MAKLKIIPGDEVRLLASPTMRVERVNEPSDGRARALCAWHTAGEPEDATLTVASRTWFFVDELERVQGIAAGDFVRRRSGEGVTMRVEGVDVYAGRRLALCVWPNDNVIAAEPRRCRFEVDLLERVGLERVGSTEPEPEPEPEPGYLQGVQDGKALAGLPSLVPVRSEQGGDVCTGCDTPVADRRHRADDCYRQGVKDGALAREKAIPDAGHDPEHCDGYHQDGTIHSLPCALATIARLRERIARRSDFQRAPGTLSKRAVAPGEDARPVCDVCGERVESKDKPHSATDCYAQGLKDGARRGARADMIEAIERGRAERAEENADLVKALDKKAP